MNAIHLITVVLITIGDQSSAVDASEDGSILIGFISESAEDEKDGVEHIEGYFQHLYDAAGDPTPRRLNVTTFRMDVIEKNRDWGKLIVDLTKFVSLSPAMIIGAYRQEIDQLIPPDIPHIVTGHKAFLNNIDIGKSKGNENVCWLTGVGNNVISLLPPLNTFLTPLQKYLLDASWPRRIVVVIMEKEEDMIQFNSGLSAGSDSLQFVRILIRKDAPYWTRNDRLVEAQKLATPHLVIHSYDLDYILQIIIGAQDLNMATYLYRWYLTYPDIKGLDDELSTFFLSHYSNVTGFQLVDREKMSQAMPVKGNGFQHAIIHDAMKLLVEATTLRNDQTSIVIEDFFEILESGFNGSTGSYGKASLTNPLTKERQFCRIRSSYEWMAFEGGEFNKIGQYFHDNNRTARRPSLINILSISNWIRPEQFSLKAPNLTYQAKPKARMPIFNNMPVSVTAVDDPPMTILQPDGTYTGVMVDYLDEYAQKLNFTYEITKLVRHDEDGGGRRYLGREGVIVTGAVRDILEQDAVLAIGAIGSTIQREVVIDFSETTFPGVISLLAKKPKIAYDTWQFLSPFTWKMWLALGVALVVISIVVTFLDLLDKSTHDLKDFPVRDSFYYTASILFFGSTDQNPNSAPMRLFIGFVAFFAIVVSQSYVANMAAFLTTRRDDESLPMTIDALSRQNAVPFGLMATGEAMQLLARARKGPYLFLWNKLASTTNAVHRTAAQQMDHKQPLARIFFDYDEAIETVKNGSFIFISESPITKYFVHRSCDLVVRDQDPDAVRYSIGMPKGALFRPELDRVITEVREEVSRDVDIIDKWYAEPECAKGGGHSMQENMKTLPLLWGEMKGLFITLGIGAGFALISALVGHFLTRAKLPKPKRKKKADRAVQEDQEPPSECHNGPGGGLGHGTENSASPATSALARPLEMTPMARLQSDHGDADEL
ncbi:glutamate receptor ionotropic, kainate glr-3-like [Lineus longissimus]|uniref:glutamate receptor ionotropic, kainate glr-3-like n=1 Tax=Lineus longissimus TaxID=88925 RepID=UPI002B4E9DB3